MNSFVITLFNLSIAASWLVIAIIVFRLLFRKAPKRVVFAVWALVAIRLVVPFFPESGLSLIPSSSVVVEDGDSLTINTGFDAVDKKIGVLTEKANQTPVGERDASPEPAESVSSKDITAKADPVVPSLSVEKSGSDGLAEQKAPLLNERKNEASALEKIMRIAPFVWAAGLGAMAIYAAVGHVSVERRVRAAVPVGDGVFASDYVSSPFVYGVFLPKIYVPSSLSGEELDHVLLHERSHIARRDNILKPLGFALLSVYWFAPAVWIAYILFCRDMELACDERAVRDCTPEERKAYSRTLVDLGRSGKPVLAGPLAFGKGALKSRIKNVLNFKKVRFWIVALVLIAAVVIGVCFMTARPSRKGKDDSAENGKKEPYTLTVEDGTATLTLYGKDGGKLFDHSDNNIKTEKLNDDVAVFSWSAGPQLSTKQTLFFDLNDRKIGGPYEYVLTYSDRFVITGSALERSVFVSDIRNEHSIKIGPFDDLSETVDPFVSAEITEGGSLLTITRLVGDDYSRESESYYLDNFPESIASAKVRLTESSGDHYTIFRKVFAHDNQKYLVCIKDDDGETVYSEEMDFLCNPRAERIDDSTLEIVINRGTGLQGRKYYSFERNTMSDEFLFVAAYRNEKVAYYDGGDKIIVRNAFDDREYHAEFSAKGLIDPDSKFPPRVSGEFTDDNTLVVTFGSVEGRYETKTVILPLATTDDSEPLVTPDDSFVGVWGDDPLFTDSIFIKQIEDGSVVFHTGIFRMYGFDATAVLKDGRYEFGEGISPGKWTGPEGVRGNIEFKEGKIVVNYDSHGVFEDYGSLMHQYLFYVKQETDDQKEPYDVLNN